MVTLASGNRLIDASLVGAVIAAVWWAARRIHQTAGHTTGAFIRAGLALWIVASPLPLQVLIGWEVDRTSPEALMEVVTRGFVALSLQVAGLTIVAEAAYRLTPWVVRRRRAMRN